MKRFIQSEIGAAVIWVIGSLLLAAVISPWMCRGGMALAAACEAGELPAVVEWLGAACGRAKFGRFFARSLLLSALILLPFLLRRIRGLRAADGALSIVIPPPLGWRRVLVQVLTGCLVAGGLLLLLGVLLVAFGAYVPQADSPPLRKFVSKVLIPAMVAPLVEEWVFRGVLLGLWLRFSRPFAASVGTSLMFAFLHFLKPPAGTLISTSGDPFSGFELLGKILLHFTDPRFFVTDFATLFGVGMILAWARIRSGALWLPIGLHAGWILAFKGFNLLYQKSPGHMLHPWGVGDNLRSGVLPMVTLALTAAVCHFGLRWFHESRNQRT